MWNAWRFDVDTWMSPKNLKKYRELEWYKWSEARKMGKSHFNTDQHHLAGNKFLLKKLIQLPIIAQCNATSSDSAEQPASIMAWLEEFRVHMESDAHKAAVEQSRKKAPEHQRLSKRICDAQWWVGRGKELSERAKNGEFHKLREWEQKAVEDYDGGKTDAKI